MVIRFNFGAENSFVPDGYILDFGRGFNEARGYGWITEASVGQENPVITGIVGNGRDRNIINSQLSDTFIHLQYPEFIDNPIAVQTPAAWEYALENGRYRISVRVGDADTTFTDSIHRINLEGIPAIQDFVPTTEQPFASATRIIEVSDGKLTIDAIGGENTKLNFVTIAPIEEVRINFGLNNSDIPLDYFRDSGQAYTSGRGYGWITEDSLGSDNPTPIDLRVNTRDRDLVSDNRFDTLIHLQYPEALGNPIAVTTSAAWEYDIPDGFYEVTLSVGDAGFIDSNHVVNLEGKQVIDFTPSIDAKFAISKSVVEVTDGKLTLDAVDGTNTKLNYIEIQPAIVSEESVISVEEIIDITVNFGTEDSLLPEGGILDTGEGYDRDRGYGWVEEASLTEDNLAPLSLTANSRDRDILEDGLSDSLLHMQYPEDLNNFDSVTDAGAWVYDLPNGEYEVTVSVGDALFTNSNHAINVEGVSVIDNFQPDLSDDLFGVGTQIIEVTDGQLSVDAMGGMNTKINYIQIESIVSDLL